MRLPKRISKFASPPSQSLTDQAALAKIAATEKNREIREAAVAKLTDPIALVQVATGATDFDVRKTAVAKLTDPASIAQVAINAQDSDIRNAAVSHLNAEDSGVCEAFLAKLAENGSSVRETGNLTGLQLALTQFLLVGERIPQEHRSRVLRALMPLAARYTEPPWVSRFGVLKHISIYWKKVGPQQYGLKLLREPINGPVFDKHDVYGEKISFSASFSGSENTVTASWETYFPDKVPENQTWINADIRIEDAYVPWLRGDPATLAK